MKKIIILFAIAFFGVSFTSVAQERYTKNTKIEKFNHKKSNLSKRDRQTIRTDRKVMKQSMKIAKADGKITRGERKMLKEQKIKMKRKLNRKRTKINQKNGPQPRGPRSSDYLGDYERRR